MKGNENGVKLPILKRLEAAGECHSRFGLAQMRLLVEAVNPPCLPVTQLHLLTMHLEYEFPGLIKYGLK